MEEKFFTCPYCYEHVSVLLDTGFEGETTIVDDCEVCCRPIEITYTVDSNIITKFNYSLIDGNSF